MKCSRDLWTKALGLAKCATAPPRHYSGAVAALTEVVVSAEHGRACIVGTDRQTEVAVQFWAEGDLPPVTAPLSTLLQCTKATKAQRGEEMEVLATKSGLALGLGGRTFEIARGFDPSERPKSLADADWTKAALRTYDAESFRRALDYAALAVCTDPTRDHIGVICLDGDRAVATDGHRMHIAAGVESFDEPVRLLPDAIAALSHAIAVADPGWLRARYRNKPPLVQFLIEGGLLNVLVTAVCGDAEFPPWQTLCAQHGHPPNGFAVDANAWHESMLAARKIAKTGGAWLAVHEQCEVSVKDAFSDAIPLLERPAAPATLSANPRYLADAAVGAESIVRVEYGVADDPLLIRPGADRFALVMPMRL
jgi:hypothetical protein